jgi:peptide/nickel transport system substrate-binding protein/oligopeptide transport system substrate-binding protein
LRSAALAGVAVLPAREGASAFPTRPAFLNPAGRPAAGEPVVITAPIEPLGQNASPSGEQLLRLAGEIQGPESLDPHVARDLPTAFLLRQIYRGLTRLGPDLQPVPELAERIEISADGLEYTFTLRPEATFHNGRQVTAADVVFSLTHALDPATAGGQAALLGGPTFLSDIVGASDLLSGTANALAGVEALDGRTVRVRLVEPRATFLMKVAAVQAAIIDQNNVALADDWWRRPNGSGPFQLDLWVPDDHITLVRFDGYFAGPPTLERIEIVLGPKAIQSFNLYQAGDVYVDHVPYTAVDSALAPNSPLRAEVTVTPALGTFYIAFRTDTPPMDDPRIRRAIFLAFPEEKVAELTYNGSFQVASGLLPNGMLGRDWPVTGEPYDLDAARAEVAASKYGSPENVPTLEIYTAFGGPADSLRDVLQDDLGLSVEVYAVDFPQLIEGLALRRYPAYAWYWGADYPDPENFIWTLFGEGGPDNYVEYDNPQMNELVRQARAEPDVEKRAALYAEAQDLLMADHVVLPLYYDVSYTIAKLFVRGLEVTPLGIVRLDTIWLEL